MVCRCAVSFDIFRRLAYEDCLQSDLNWVGLVDIVSPHSKNVVVCTGTGATFCSFMVNILMKDSR